MNTPPLMSDTPHPRQDTTAAVSEESRKLVDAATNSRLPFIPAQHERKVAALLARLASLESDLSEARTEAETFRWAFDRLCDETESRKRMRGALRVREGKQFVSYHRGRVVEVCDTHEEAAASLELIRQNFPADDVSVMTFEVSALPSREVPKE